MARSVLDAPCSLNEYGGDHFEEHDYETACPDCVANYEEDASDEVRDGSFGLAEEHCADTGCSCSCHFPDEPEEPEDGS